MKKFKEIRSRINEDHEYAIANAPDVAHGRSQAVNHELKKGFMSPSTAISNLRTKLNFVGFDFDLKDVPSSGKLSLPLKSATETFGKKGDTPFDEFAKDETSTGLTLTVTISQNDDGLYKLNGKIK